MDMFGHVKNVVRELIDISLVLIALAIVLSILVAVNAVLRQRVTNLQTSLANSVRWPGGLIVLVSSVLLRAQQHCCRPQ